MLCGVFTAARLLLAGTAFTAATAIVIIATPSPPPMAAFLAMRITAVTPCTLVYDYASMLLVLVLLGIIIAVMMMLGRCSTIPTLVRTTATHLGGGGGTQPAPTATTTSATVTNTSNSFEN